MSDVLLLAVLVLPFVLLYLFVLRPAQQRNQQAAALAQSLEVGEQVMTTSGLYGTVVELDDETVRLEVSSGVVVRFARRAVGRRLTPGPGVTGAGEHD